MSAVNLAELLQSIASPDTKRTLSSSSGKRKERFDASEKPRGKKRKKKKKRKQQHQKHQQTAARKQPQQQASRSSSSASAAAAPAATQLSDLQQRMRGKLEGAQFRWLNEALYTGTGGDAFDLFAKQPAYFDAYHRGFRNAVKNWPANPLDYFIATLDGMVRSGDVRVVADFGCGDAQLASTLLTSFGGDDDAKAAAEGGDEEEDGAPVVAVHSFDLHASNELVTACNMADVPLRAGACDVAVFCLSLMGVNFVDYLHEAHRVLRPGCLLMIVRCCERGEASPLGSPLVPALTNPPPPPPPPPSPRLHDDAGRSRVPIRRREREQRLEVRALHGAHVWLHARPQRPHQRGVLHLYLPQARRRPDTARWRRGGGRLAHRGGEEEAQEEDGEGHGQGRRPCCCWGQGRVQEELRFPLQGLHVQEEVGGKREKERGGETIIG